MFKELFSNSGWLSKFLQLIFVSLLLLFVGFFVWTMAGGDVNSIVSQKIFQLITAILFFIVPVLFLSRYWYQKPITEYALDKAPALFDFLLVVLLMFAVQPSINLLSYFNEQLHLPDALKMVEDKFRAAEDSAGEITKKFLEVKSIGGYIFNVFLIAMLPAFGEELYFRGAMQKIFSTKYTLTTAIWVTAVIFSLFHFQMFGFIPRMLLGAMFGYLLCWTRSLWIPVTAHFINNFIGVSLVYFSKNQPALNRLETIGKKDTMIYGIASVAVSILILWIIYSKSRKK